MKTLNTLILSILCTTSFFLHSSTHEELLHYDLSQRKAMQKLVKTIRNITGITTLLGLISYIYIGKQQNKKMEQDLAMLQSITRNDPMPNFEPFVPLPFYLNIPIALSALGFFPSLTTFVANTLYGIYNSMQIETLEQELNRIGSTKR